MKRNISVLLLSVIVFFFFLIPSIHASSVDQAAVSKMVRGWQASSVRPLGINLGGDISSIEGYGNIDNSPAYYVVYFDGGGYIIAAGDDEVEPIIAIVEKGVYLDSDQRSLGALVRKDIPKRIEAVRTIPKSLNIKLEATTRIAKEKWSQYMAAGDAYQSLGISTISDVRVAPLVQSQWGQRNVEGYSNTDACYNYYTPPGPDGSNNNYPCGCVATAMAQLIRYHQYPTIGIGSPYLGGDGFGGPYVWSNMPLIPVIGTGLTQRQAIGALCFDAAKSVDMSFDPNGSLALLRDADIELVNTFYYSNSIYGQDPSTGNALNNILNPNLDAGLPVILGLSGSGGHAVVCDGYGYNGSTLYHHLNMGWTGEDNAWYNLPYVDAYYYYNVIDDCVYNILMSGSGEIISGRVTDIVGNPVSGVTVIATGPGTYQDETDSEGIYALAGVPSGSSYTISASKAPYVFPNQNVSTGSSSDWGSTSGNKWGVDFTSVNTGPPTAYDQNVLTMSGQIEPITLVGIDDGQPDPPGSLCFKILTLPEHGELFDPNAGLITNVPYTLANDGNTVEYQSCSYFTGPDAFEFVANDYGTSPTGGDSQPATVLIDVNNTVHTLFEVETDFVATWPIDTSYHDQRTQVIYLSSEIGDTKRITDMALNINEVPGQILNNFTIRMRNTNRSEFLSYPIYDDYTPAWIVVYQNYESISSQGWHNFHLQTPFEYDGTSNLMVDFSYNNSSYSIESSCYISQMPGTRVTISYCNSTHGDPLYWTDSYNPGIYLSSGVPNIKLISEVITDDAVASDIDVDCSVDFVDFSIISGEWSARETDHDIAPPGGDMKVDFLDWAQFANNWSGPDDMDDLSSFALDWLVIRPQYADIAPASGDDKVDFKDLQELIENWLIQ